MPQTSAECPFCTQPFRPGEGKVEVSQWGGAFHPGCYTIKARIERHRAEDAKEAAEKSGRSEPAVARTDYGEAEKKQHHVTSEPRVSVNGVPIHRCDYCHGYIMPDEDAACVFTDGSGVKRYHKGCTPKDDRPSEPSIFHKMNEAICKTIDAHYQSLKHSDGGRLVKAAPEPTEAAKAHEDAEANDAAKLPDPPPKTKDEPETTRLVVQSCKALESIGIYISIAYMTPIYQVGRVQAILNEPGLTTGPNTLMAGNIFSRIKEAVGSDDVAVRFIQPDRNVTDAKQTTIIRGGRFETEPTLWMEFLQACR